MKDLFTAIHQQNKELDPVYEYYHSKHSDLCNRFDEVGEMNGFKAQAEGYSKLCMEMLDAFSELYEKVKKC